MTAAARAALTTGSDFSMPDTVRRSIPIQDRLIVALDVDGVEEARRVVDALGDSVNFYKIGLGLQFREGAIAFAKELKLAGKKIFFDTKIYDIGLTTKSAVQSIAALGFDFLTVHGTTATLKEAVVGRGDSALKLFAITVLTSLDDQDLFEMGYTVDVKKMVEYRTKSAMDAGCDGVITSGLEVEMIRRLSEERNNQLLIVTPGIRSAGVSHDDQKRVVTPEMAMKAGADYIVMARQILRATNCKDEAEKVLESINDAI
jgi:orotidine-5'-phosphate decarboxylase